MGRRNFNLKRASYDWMEKILIKTCEKFGNRLLAQCFLEVTAKNLCRHLSSSGHQETVLYSE